MAQRLNALAIENASWWCGRFELVHHLEYPSTHLDRTIHRLRRDTVRQHPDLRRFLEILGVPPLWMLAYQALAEGPYGMVRLAALFPTSPFEGGEPQVFALDGDRRSLHRNPPYDDGVEGVSAHLCLYYRDDPDERRWTAEYGLIELFDLARRHLVCEHVWRETDVWPTEDAPHGITKPARRRPELKVAPLRATAVEVK
ncbi:MAG: hypothetical protein ACRDM7_18290 [Thermoleophilaceae bacterium]